jgi:hypothetical protein
VFNAVATGATFPGAPRRNSLEARIAAVILGPSHSIALLPLAQRCIVDTSM